MSLLRLLSIACCTLILSAATTGTPFAWPHNPSVNVPICTREPVQGGVVMCSDGAGGAIIAFVDMNLGGPLIFQDDVYIQRVDASGSVLWTPGGVAVCTLGEDQSHIAIAPDGVGGAIVAWQDRRSGTSYDIYAQRIDASGAPQWTANGVPVSTTVGNQTTPAIVSSGGRAIVTWSDDRSGDADIYAQLVDVNGTRRWTTNGVSVCQEIGTQQDPAILGLPSFPDETIIAWEDRRGADFDLYAQRLGRTGSSHLDSQRCRPLHGDREPGADSARLGRLQRRDRCLVGRALRQPRHLRASDQQRGGSTVDPRRRGAWQQFEPSGSPRRERGRRGRGVGRLPNR